MSVSVISIIIFAIVIILFIVDKIPSGTVALMGLTAMLAFKCCTTAEALSGFASDTFLLLLGMLIIGEALFSSGAAAFIGHYAIRLSHNNERRFILISCIISALMSAFLTNTAVIAMMMTVCLSASKSGSMKYKNLVIPVAISAILGGHCTLVGSTTQLTAQSLLQDAAGIGFGMWDLLYVCGPITIISILYITFIAYPQGKKIWGERVEQGNSDCAEMDLSQSKLSVKGKISLSIFALVIILFVTNAFSTGVVSMIGAVLCILTGCISQKEAFKRIDWNTIVWLCSCLGIGKALNVSGGASIIAGKLLYVFGDCSSPFLFFALMVFAAMLLSEFMSNMACLMIIMPATLELAIANGINPYTMAYGMCLGAALTYATPLANGHIGMTLSAGYKFSDYIKYGTIPTLIAYIGIITLTPLFFPL